MIIEQYQGILFLVLGFSVFFIMSFTLKIMSLKNKMTLKNKERKNLWLGFESLRILDIVQESLTIKSFILCRENQGPIPPFRAGQFISIQTNNDPKIIRSYSISSSPSVRHFLQISVKKIVGGQGSTWLHQLEKGDCLKATPPQGHFYDDEKNQQESRVLIAGGVGITPLVSILQNHLEKGIDSPIYLFYGARYLADLAFYELILYFQRRYKNFKFVCRLSDEDNAIYPKGLITFDLLISHLKHLTNKKYFICGPQPMSESIFNALKNGGVSDQKIFIEKFVSPTMLTEECLPIRQANVRFQDVLYPYNGRLNLLSFLEEKGLELPFGCRSGVCGSCKCKAEGKITSLSDSGLTGLEKQEGYILTCVSYPEGEVVLYL